MKRDMDLIRELLLEIEEKDNDARSWIIYEQDEVEGNVLTEHLFLLAEAGMIEGNNLSHMQGREYGVRRLTWRGHDFLDSIRDDEIWAKTKAGAKAAGGFTVELLGDLAKGLVRTKIKQHTGVDV